MPVQSPNRLVVARRHYRMLELQSRIESSSPQDVVRLLYEDLLRALDLAVLSIEKDDAVSGRNNIGRALSIIVALENSLDLERGDELAPMLARIYRSCTRGLDDAVKTGNAGKLKEIRKTISNIAYAYQILSGA